MATVAVPAVHVEGVWDSGLTWNGRKVYASNDLPYGCDGYVIEHVVCPCNTPGDFPMPCGIHSPQWFAPTVGTVTIKTYEDVRSLSDEDVRRIAREVVREMVRANHDPGDED
jgi:hypothetical protein